MKAKALASIFLGRDKDFPGPAWFSLGQIDVAVAEQEGVASDDPEERVAGALAGFIGELMLSKNNDPDWKAKSDAIMKRFTYLFMGIPEYF